MFGSRNAGRDGSKRSSLNGSPLTGNSSSNVASMSKSHAHRGGGKRWGDTGKQHGPKRGR